ncbi:MAG: T9SS type A sorting domain-containing protein [Bacteroidetes bacterium]|nr:T9SS type A sorting domain-containing protein [Bacteroidota bacterium]
MMKQCLFLILFIFSLIESRAEVNGLYFPKKQIEPGDTKAMMQFLSHYFNDLAQSDIQLKLVYEKKTRASLHSTYSILYKNYEILHASIKVNSTIDGNVMSIKREGKDVKNCALMDASSELYTWQKIDIEKISKQYLQADEVVKNVQYKIDNSSESPKLVAEIHSWSSTYDNTWVVDSDGNLLHHFDHSRHVFTDTLIHAKVFNPDPLTTANQSYGGIFIDNNDANASWMNATYFLVDIPATFDTGNSTFYLENDFVMIDELESPTISIATSLDENFLFDRSMSGFEQVNAFFHITNYHDYISSLGYDTLMDRQIVVDAHGQFGADNSVFNRNGGNPTLIFGTGGVDDAEDADVILHEYAHALSWDANNNSNFSNERAGLDEGLADYFATSYSRSQQNYHWDSMFTWDGHNQFWGGRTAVTAMNYPATIPNIYATGEIWNCAMSAIWGDLGQIVTDKLMLETLHFLTDNASLPEAATYVLQADTILFAGMHTSTICNRFQQKNIFDSNCKPTAAKEFAVSKFELMNSLGFAQGNSDAMVQLPENKNCEIVLMDISGNKIKTQAYQAVRQIRISSKDLASGMYFLQIKTKDDIAVFKLNKF